LITLFIVLNIELWSIEHGYYYGLLPTDLKGNLR